MSVHSDKLASLANVPGIPVARSTLSVQRQKRLYRMALLGADMVMLTAAFLMAYWLRFDLQFSLAPEVTPSPVFYSRLVAALLPLWLGMFAFYGLYDWRKLMGGTTEYAATFNACTTTMMLVVLATFLQPDFVVARGWIVFSWLLSIVFVCGARFGARRLAYALRRRGYFLVPAAVVGTNGEAAALIEELTRWEVSGLSISGVVLPDSVDASAVDLGLPVLGSVSEAEEIARIHGIQEFVVAGNSLDGEQLLNLFDQVHTIPEVELRFSTGLFEVLTTGVEVKNLGSVPLVSLNKLRLEPREALLKTVVEYTLTVAGLVVLLPFMGLIALLIKLDSPGPVLHYRRVMGVGRREFNALKFRTMYVNGDEILERFPKLQEQLRAEEKLKDDPRVTRLGRFLRRFSLDELPQLFNVLAGQMSLVGPRMISPAEAEKYGRHKTNLLTVKPGITGLWQVSGRSDLTYEERVRLDMQYIRNYSIWVDLQILFILTAAAVIRGRGAY